MYQTPTDKHGQCVVPSLHPNTMHLWTIQTNSDQLTYMPFEL